MNLPELNIPLLRKALEWAEAENAKTDGTSLWNQAAYAMTTECGTAFCIAGWTVANFAEGVSVQPYPTGYGKHPGELVTAVHPDGLGVVWEHDAAQLLGLTADEAWALFEVDNDIDDIRRISEMIAARAGERL